MRAISIKQPWAEAILQGVKKVENRTWSPTGHGGKLILHTGLNMDRQGQSWLLDCYLDESVRGPRWDGCVQAEPWVLGAYLGVIEITGVDPRFMPPPDGPDPWRDEDQWGWRIGRVLRFPKPISGKGRQGLFYPPPMVIGYAKAEWAKMEAGA